MIFPDESRAPVFQTLACQFLRCIVCQQGDEIHKSLLRHITVVHQRGVGKVELLPVVGEQVGLAGFGFRQGGGDFRKRK